MIAIANAGAASVRRARDFLRSTDLNLGLAPGGRACMGSVYVPCMSWCWSAGAMALAQGSLPPTAGQATRAVIEFVACGPLTTNTAQSTPRAWACFTLTTCTDREGAPLPRDGALGGDGFAVGLSDVDSESVREWSLRPLFGRFVSGSRVCPVLG